MGIELLGSDHVCADVEAIAQASILLHSLPLTPQADIKVWTDLICSVGVWT